MNKEKNEKLANDLRDFIVKHEIIDTRIYFNNVCYDWSGNDFGDTSYKLLEDIKSTEFFEYGNDNTVSMSFEGFLYDVINYESFHPEHRPILKEFDEIFEKHDCYYELGYAWSLSVFFD
jgi:hypothetical protein